MSLLNEALKQAQARGESLPTGQGHRAAGGFGASLDPGPSNPQRSLVSLLPPLRIPAPPIIGPAPAPANDRAPGLFAQVRKSPAIFIAVAATILGVCGIALLLRGDDAARPANSISPAIGQPSEQAPGKSAAVLPGYVEAKTGGIPIPRSPMQAGPGDQPDGAVSRPAGTSNPPAQKTPSGDGGGSSPGASITPAPGGPGAPGESAGPRAQAKADPPKLSFTATWRSGSGAAAVLNGQVLHVGESIEGATVVQIGQRTVELEFHGERFTLRM